MLEGGYSIQGALPYVNCGIALAMAGLDYSFVREPDYNPVALRQAPRITSYIDQLADAVLENYFHPKPKQRYARESWSAGRNGYSTTPMVYPKRQIESVLVCETCAGMLRIETSSTVNPQSLCIEIPSGACDHCREEGLAQFENAERAGAIVM